MIKRLVGYRTTDKQYIRWTHLDDQYVDTRVFKMTRRTYWIFGCLPVWRRIVKLVEIPVWLQVRRMTLGY